jgi:hypothetical protein
MKLIVDIIYTIYETTQAESGRVEKTKLPVKEGLKLASAQRLVYKI